MRRSKLERLRSYWDHYVTTGYRPFAMDLWWLECERILREARKRVHAAEIEYDNYHRLIGRPK